MKNYELYVNGVLIDLERKFTFGLVYNSTAFTDISKIVSNRTTTIKLPKTVNNLRAISNCQLPDRPGMYPYQNHAIKLYCEGIPLIEGGTMTLIAVNQYIEISVIWGNKANTAPLQDKKLRELAGNEYVMWVGGSVISTSNRDYGFTMSDFGFLTIRYTHPFVSAKWIMNKIKAEAGLQISIPEKIIEDYEGLYIPLIEKNPAPLVNGDKSCVFAFDQHFNLEPVQDPDAIISGNTFLISEDSKVFFEGDVALPSTFASQNIHWTKIHFYLNNAEYYVIKKEDNDTEFTFDSENKVYAKAGDTISLRYEVKYGKWPSVHYAWNPDVNILPGKRGNLTLHIEPIDVVYGQKYPIINNLPDITCLDFLKTVMHIFGLFATYDIDGIVLFSVDEIYNRKTSAKNWTGKLITIDDIVFTFQDYAGKNYLRYQPDETVKVDADGYIEVRNESLEKEKNIAELKFAASESGTNNLIRIPIYRMETKDDGTTEIVYEKTSTNRIAVIRFNESTQAAQGAFFNDLYFSGGNGLIAKYYQNYQRILANPKVLTASFLLSVMDLHNIDLITPIYLEQTGHYYAIIEIQSTDDKAKCKLLQM
jgi:hypothetical protein